MYKNTMRRPDGYAKIVDPSGIKLEADTKQCCHCGGHFIPVKGSGKIRGWCRKCHAMTCGKLECCKCEPFEEKLKTMESA